MVTRIKRDTEIEAMAHLTCVGASRKELEEQLGVICDAGISNVLALRGDPPRGQREFAAHPDGLAHASDLVLLAREVADKRGVKLCIGAACYPEGHPETRDLVQDLRHCKSKVTRGGLPHHPALLRQPELLPVPGQGAGRGHRGADLPGIMPITTSIRSSVSRRCAAPIFPWVFPRRCGRAATTRTRRCSWRSVRGAAVRRSAEGRRAGRPFLHAEPQHGDPGHPGGAAGAGTLARSLTCPRRSRGLACN